MALAALGWLCHLLDNSIAEARRPKLQCWKSFRKKIQEDLIQSQVRFNRVLEKVPEKVPEKIIGAFGVEPSKIQ